ncbi:DUF6221 family protein [Streptomyces anthocyanicus]
MTLTEFLLARIAEDEAAAERVLLDYGGGDLESLEARVLAECEAKRRIVSAHPLIDAHDVWGREVGGLSCETCNAKPDLVLSGVEQPRTDGCATLRALALPFTDHPDYDEAWRP